MKVWILFLFVSFLIGGAAQRRQHRERFIVMLGLCVVVAFALYSRRWA